MATTEVTENSWRISPLSGTRVEKHFSASFAVSWDFILSSGPRINDIIMLFTLHDFSQNTGKNNVSSEDWLRVSAGWLHLGGEDMLDPFHHGWQEVEIRNSPEIQGLVPVTSFLQPGPTSQSFYNFPKIPPPNIQNMNPWATFYIKPQQIWSWLAAGSWMLCLLSFLCCRSRGSLDTSRQLRDTGPLGCLSNS